MKPEPTTTGSAITTAVDLLELEAGQPVLPGELREWCDTLLSSLGGVDMAWQRFCDEHQAILERVVRDDPALLPRAEKAMHSIAELDRGRGRLREESQALLDEDSEHPTASAEPTDRVEDCRNRVLEWVVRFRAFRGQVRTLLAESVYRDRGVAD